MEDFSEHKSVIGVIFVIIFVLLLLGGISYGGYYYYKNGYLNNDDKTSISRKTTFFVVAKDYITGENTNLNYEIFEAQNIEECLSEELFELYQEKPEEFYELLPMLRGNYINEKGCYVKKQVFTKVNEGKLYEGYNLITINAEVPNLFYYYSDNYYVNKELWLTGFMSYVNLSKDQYDTFRKQPDNKTVNTVFSHKKSNYVNISLLGEVKSNSNTIARIEIQGVPLQLRRVNVCLQYTLNIGSVNGNYQEVIPPKRLIQANKCYKTYESLSSQNDYKLQLDFNVTALNLDEDDAITVYVVDEELVYNTEDWVYKVEDNIGRDVGAQDFSKQFKVYK